MLLVPTHNISQGSHAGLSDTIRQACCSTLSNSRLGSQLYMCCSPRWLNRKNLVNHSEQWKTSLHRPLFYMSSKQWITNRTVSSPTFHCVLWHLHKDHMRTMFFFFLYFFLGGTSKPTRVPPSHITSKKCDTEREEVDIQVIFFRIVLASHTQSTLSILVKTGCVRVFMYGSFKRLYRKDFKKSSAGSTYAASRWTAVHRGS